MTCYWLNLPELSIGLEGGFLPAGSTQQFEHVLDLTGPLRTMLEEQKKARERLTVELADLAAAAHCQAKLDADEILAEARSQADDIADVARREGFASGMAEAAADWHSRRLDAAFDAYAKLDAQHEAIARIAALTVERMVATESPQALYEKALSQAGNLMKGTLGALLRVHPDRLDEARRAVMAFIANREPLCCIEVVADLSLALGGCVFESEQGALDASLDIQLGALRAAFAQAVPTDDPAPEPDIGAAEDGEMSTSHLG